MKSDNGIVVIILAIFIILLLYKNQQDNRGATNGVSLTSSPSSFGGFGGALPSPCTATDIIQLTRQAIENLPSDITDISIGDNIRETDAALRELISSNVASITDQIEGLLQIATRLGYSDPIAYAQVQDNVYTNLIQIRTLLTQCSNYRGIRSKYLPAVQGEISALNPVT
jgi:hypothetical protein